MSREGMNFGEPLKAITGDTTQILVANNDQKMSRLIVKHGDGSMFKESYYYIKYLFSFWQKY
jgi:hypothetical protein